MSSEQDCHIENQEVRAAESQLRQKEEKLGTLAEKERQEQAMVEQDIADRSTEHQHLHDEARECHENRKAKLSSDVDTINHQMEAKKRVT